MSFLDSLLGSMDAPPKQDPVVVAAAKARKDKARQAAKEEREREEKFEALITAAVEEFVNGPATIKKFDPMSADKREMLHRTAAKRGIITYAFGEEDVDRRVVCFKTAVAPLAAHVQLMDRSLPYQACMDDLEEKLKTKAATDVAAKKETRAEGPAKKAPVSHRNERLQQLLGDTTKAEKPKEGGSYGIVPAHLRTDKRTIEEVENDLRAKRARKDASRDS